MSSLHWIVLDMFAAESRLLEMHFIPGGAEKHAACGCKTRTEV